ncbi:hypothetical protein [Dysgonomonas sp. ZJ709]|uniref:hypothetical protein n=1 Tax=Dysgonomonas sp. ZJ709 TaxID=2709797 RepID=UPI0013EB9532|nr:hypothetical protein [Dysgonomonas sp. ZJ709]
MEANCSGVSKSTSCRGTNVYVNCCCPDDGDGGGQSGFKGTNVYVDSKNESATADGTINNPFKTVLDAFKYVDSSDENYIIHIISMEWEERVIDYELKSKGHLGVVGSGPYCINQNIYSFESLSLRVSGESYLFLGDMSIDTLNVYGAEGAMLDNLLSANVNMYDIRNRIFINNCRSYFNPCSLALRFEKEMSLMANLDITNSSISLLINNAVYYGRMHHCYVSSISTTLPEGANNSYPLIQLETHGCTIGYIDNGQAMESSYFNLGATSVNFITEISEDMPKVNIHSSGFYTETAFAPINYSPESRSLTANLEAIDKKLGELQAGLGA